MQMDSYNFDEKIILWKYFIPKNRYESDRKLILTYKVLIDR